MDRRQGEATTIEAEIPAGCSGKLECVEVDVSDDASVAAAAAAVRASLGADGKLYGLVNNAGIGLGGQDSDAVMNTNLYGTKRVTEAFLNLVTDRIVNVGSGSGPSYVRNCPISAQTALCSVPEDWAAIEALAAPSADGTTGQGSAADTNGSYGLSKAMITQYTMLLAKQNPALVVSCCTPGFIDTKLTAGFGASKKPAEGTVAIKHCLFGDLAESGWYYGSDGVRSPLHFMRNPGEPVYDGVVPTPADPRI